MENVAVPNMAALEVIRLPAGKEYRAKDQEAAGNPAAAPESCCSGKREGPQEGSCCVTWVIQTINHTEIHAALPMQFLRLRVI